MARPALSPCRAALSRLSTNGLQSGCALQKAVALWLPGRPTRCSCGPTTGALSPQQGLDRLVLGLAGRAGVVLPAGAAAHAFRHYYGVSLPLRGVPGNVISQVMGHADPPPRSKRPPLPPSSSPPSMTPVCSANAVDGSQVLARHRRVPTPVECHNARNGGRFITSERRVPCRHGLPKPRQTRLRRPG